MKAVYVTPTRLPLSFDEAAGSMNAALAGVLNATPATPVLALALAKTALETGRWTAIWNNNWGNVKAGENYEGLFTCITLNEVFPAGVTWFAPEGQLSRKGGEVIGKRWDVPPGHPQTRMRAYREPLDGAVEYVQFVASGRYRDAWKELLEGDAGGYVHALKMRGYFTADEATYARGVVALQKEFVAKLQARPAPELTTPAHDEIRGLLAPQDWNQREIHALAVHAATESKFDLLSDRSDAHAQIMGADDEDEPTKPDLPGNIT